MSVTRRTFVQGLAVLGSGALVGCGRPLDGSVLVTNNQALLTFAEFPALNTVGAGVIVAAGTHDAIVIRTSATTATALSAMCTHANCLLTYEKDSADPIECGCHGSAFALDGTVLRGPAVRALQIFSATVVATGINVLF
jgi:cytochrome b6-f complex iron-sulfur subunit